LFVISDSLASIRNIFLGVAAPDRNSVNKILFNPLLKISKAKRKTNLAFLKGCFQGKLTDSQCFGLTKALIKFINLRPVIDFVYNGDVIAGRDCFDEVILHADAITCKRVLESLCFQPAGAFLLVVTSMPP